MISPTIWTLVAIRIAMGAFDTLYHHESLLAPEFKRDESWSSRIGWVRNR
jgi:hypothetical protein